MKTAMNGLADAEEELRLRFDGPPYTSFNDAFSAWTSDASGSL